MPRRVDSDEDDSEQRKKKTRTTQKNKKPAAKPRTSSSRAKAAPNGGSESVISAWAKRQTVESLDGIEDVEPISPRRERQRPKFEVDDGIISLMRKVDCRI